MMPLPPDLIPLVRIIAEWLKSVPGVRRLYLYGSRVRGDHRSDSDVDLRIFRDDDLDADDSTADWWTHQHKSHFAELEDRLPEKLHLVFETDVVDPAIREGAEDPVHVEGRVICVLTPPKAKAQA